MSPERFEHLSNFCWSVNSQTRHKLQMSIPAKKRLVITLRYLAEGCSQQTLSFSFQVGKSTVSKILKEVCEALYTVLVTHYLLPPSTVEDWKLISSEFLELWNMPHVIGAIDGKHVAMNAQKILGHYINYKGFFSQVLLAVCDAKYKFIFIDVRQYGSTNNSVVLKNSELGRHHELYSLNIPSEDIADKNYQFSVLRVTGIERRCNICVI